MVIWGRDVRWRGQLSDATLSRWPDDIVLVSYEREAEVPSHRKIVICDQLTGGALVDAGNRKSPNRHLIQADHPDFDLEVNLAALMISRPGSVVANPVAALVTFLGKCNLRRFGFSEHSQKRATLDQIAVYTGKLTASDALISSVYGIADEMFTNAIFSEKKRARSAPPEELDSDHAGIFLLHDSERLIVGCEDFIGAVDPCPVLDRLYDCYEKGAGNVINLSGGGGAGIGCYLMMEQSTSFFILVSPGSKTVVLAVLPLNGYLRRIQSTHKNLHLVALPKSG